MKKFQYSFYAGLLCCTSFVATAQTTAPAGFKNAIIKLSNGNTLTGFAKDNIKKASAVVFADSAGNKKQYDGNAIQTITIDTVNFICIKGDFFKLLRSGKIDFLQKAGNAAANPVYNGSEALFINGTEGKIGDYFVYTGNTLQLLNKNNVEAFITTGLAGCAAAIQKAKASNGDMAKIAEAVEMFNNYAAK